MTKYKNPPVVEVVAELRFKPVTPWDLVFPGLVWEKLRHEFPKRRQLNVFGQLPFGQPPHGVDKAAAGQIQFQLVSETRTQFIREDESALIQFAPNFLAINHLRPYTDWETSFVPILRSGLAAYQEIVGEQPAMGLTLQYVNNLQIPTVEQTCRYEDYLNFKPSFGEPLPQDHGPCFMSVFYPFESARDWLKVELRTIEIGAEKGLFQLHLQYSLNKTDLEGSLTDWFNVAHGHIEDIFEACINERLRDIFQRTD